MSASLKESWGSYPSAEIELIDEGGKARLRVREPHGKASIFLTRGDLQWLAEQALLLEHVLSERGAG